MPLGVDERAGIAERGTEVGEQRDALRGRGGEELGRALEQPGGRARLVARQGGLARATEQQAWIRL